MPQEPGINDLELTELQLQKMEELLTLVENHLGTIKSRDGLEPKLIDIAATVVNDNNDISALAENAENYLDSSCVAVPYWRHPDEAKVLHTRNQTRLVENRARFIESQARFIESQARFAERMFKKSRKV